MQNQDPGSQSPVIDELARSASENRSRALAAAGRRRTQEQGQGDLDDDRQDPPPAAPQEVAGQGPSDPKRP
jgi:hypothetical protein